MNFLRSGDTVKQFCPGKTNWVIEAKVMSCWFDTRGAIGIRKMIIADEEGDKIEAVIPFGYYKNEIPKYIEEGRWYVISDFLVRARPESRRNTKHQYSIKFVPKTLMYEVIRHVTPQNYFVFEDVLNIRNGLACKEFPVDVFGIIIEFTQVTNQPNEFPEVEVYGNGYRSVHFKLLDPKMERITCRAIGFLADEFVKVWNAGSYGLKYKKQPVFCVLRFWKIATCEGEQILVNDYGCSRFWFDPELYGLDNQKTISEFAGRYHINHIISQDEASTSEKA
ncbi:Nucleic acid-binding OB-fold [Arabidopsis suecica]|uniref:Nucleic acid-binding OB-fold n=1 Tax=Arabidopsis suecica TaxID=45249 RepID=A0A8T2BF93_ARASU|nr:Nucleic acid-binding OB-fold [Arabidopsis suecica]